MPTNDDEPGRKAGRNMLVWIVAAGLVALLLVTLFYDRVAGPAASERQTRPAVSTQG